MEAVPLSIRSDDDRLSVAFKVVKNRGPQGKSGQIVHGGSPPDYPLDFIGGLNREHQSVGSQNERARLSKKDEGVFRRGV